MSNLDALRNQVLSTTGAEEKVEGSVNEMPLSEMIACSVFDDMYSCDL